MSLLRKAKAEIVGRISTFNVPQGEEEEDVGCGSIHHTR